MYMQLRLTLALIAAIAVAGCNAIGPGSVQRGRLDYAAAISDLWKEQALLTSSMMEMLVELSAGIGVPQQHLADGRARAFTFLRIFSSIAETGAVPQVPIITIPAN